MNQHPETPPVETATAQAVEQTHLQHLDGLLEVFRRESEQATAAFQATVAKSQEGALQRVVELRGALVEELKGLQQNVLSKSKLEADEVLRKANGSAEELLGQAKAQAAQQLERSREEAQEVVAKAQAEAAEVSSRAAREAEAAMNQMKLEGQEILNRANAEADDLVVRASAEADVIVARATTVAAEKVLAKRSVSSSLVGKGVTSDRLSDDSGAEAAPAILSPEEEASSSKSLADPQNVPASDAFSALSGRFASGASPSGLGASAEPVLSPIEPQALTKISEGASPAIEAGNTGQPPVIEPVTEGTVTREVPAAPLVDSPVVAEMAAPAPNESYLEPTAPVEPATSPEDTPAPLPVSPDPAPVSLDTAPVQPIASPVAPTTEAFTLPPLPAQITEHQALTTESAPEEVEQVEPVAVAVPVIEPIVPDAIPEPVETGNIAPQESPFVTSQIEAIPAEASPVPEVAALADVSELEIPPMATAFTAIPGEPVAAEVPVPEASPFVAVAPEVSVPATPTASHEDTRLEREVLLGIVSANTGYPLEMLEEHLDSGLKLDLTPPKVVEILGRVKSSFPAAPEIELTRIPQFLDLGRLVGYLARPAVAKVAPSEPEPIPEAVETEPPSSPFQLAAETPPTPAVDAEGSPFQTLDPIEAVPSSPFALAVEAMAESAVAEAPATPFQPLTANEVAPSDQSDSPFTPAEPEMPSSPFVAVAAAAEIDEPAEEALAEAVPDAPVDRHVIRGQVTTACGLGLPQLHLVDIIHIVPDDRRVAEALRDLLLAEGFQAELAESVPPTANAAILMNGLCQVTSSEQASAIQLDAFRAARSVVQDLADRRGLFVTVQDTGGDFGMSAESVKDAWAGGLSGLARSVAAECPDVGVKALDVEREGRSAEVLARRILRELTEGGPEVEVGLSSDGTRLTQGLEATEISKPGVTNLPVDGTVVVHGAGLGILTDPVLEMAKAQRQRFALLGSVVMQEEDDDPFVSLSDPEDIRSALMELSRHQGEHAASPEVIEQQLNSFLQQREVRRLMSEIRAAGSQVCYFAADSCDAGALEAVLNQVRGQWGGVAALLHASGLREEGRIATKTDAQVANVLRSNLAGIENLLKLTKQDPLQLIGFLSPSLHESGSAGHSDYAMANETLNRVACAEAHRRGGHCVVRSINWAFCDDGTVSSQVAEGLRGQGIEVIPREQTGRMIVDELSNNSRGDIQVLLAPRRPSGRAVLHTSYLNAQAEVQVNQANSPQLQDHKVQGSPAVPGVMVMEWFMRNARQMAGSKGFLRCRDFQQLQGIALPDFGKVSVPFSIVMDSVSSFQWGGQSSVRLIDADGQLRYAALLEQVEDKESLGLTAAPELELERTAWTGSHVYGPGALFHGPSFQVIHRVEGVSPQGALGRLLPPEDANWPEDTYLFHPAMIDGITQLAFVWGLFTQDSEFFVTSIGEFVQAPHPNYNQALRCVLEGLESSPEYLRLNAYLESDSGDTIAVMRNVECHPVPSRQA